MLKSKAAALQANSAREAAEKIEAIRAAVERVEAKLDRLAERLSDPDTARQSNAKAKGG